MDKKSKCLFFAVLLLAIIGIVLPELDIGETTFINATTINSTGLTPNSGNNTQLISEMNAGYWEGNETAGNPFNIDVFFFNVTSFDAIDIASRYFSSSATPSTHQVDLMVWCTIHEEFMKLKVYNNEPDWYGRTYAIYDSSHYIMSNGTVIVRLQHLDNGNSNHVMRIDTLRLLKQPTFKTETNNFYTNITGSTTPGTTNHANLTNLNWSASGHTIDTNFNLSGNFIINIAGWTNQTLIKLDLLGGFIGDYYASIEMSKANEWLKLISKSNIITVYDNRTTMNSMLDMQGNNITNITKLTSSGDFSIEVLNGFYTLSSQQIPTNYRVGQIVTPRTTLLTALNLKMYSGSGGCISGCGASVNMFNVGNDTARTEYNVGRFGYAWDNVSLNTSKIQFFARNGVADTTGSNTNLFNGYGSNGTMNIPSLAGAGNAYVCVDSSGNLYRGSPTC